MDRLKIIICCIVMVTCIPKAHTSKQLADQLTHLHDNLKNLREKLKSLGDRLTELAGRLSKPKLEKMASISALITALNDFESKKSQKKPCSLDFIDTCDEILTKEFVTLSKTISIITLLKEMVREIFSGKQISWYGPMGDRIIFIFRILDDALRVFGEQKDQLFTHVEYGESGCLQSYILAYGLLNVGFRNITVHTVSLGAPTDNTKAMQDELNKLEIIKSGQAKITAIAFDKNDYLKRSSKRWSHQGDTLYQTIKCGSYAMLSPIWGNEHFVESEMATNFVEAIVQTLNSEFYYIQDNSPEDPHGPRIYIMMHDGRGGQFQLNYDWSDDYAHSISVYKKFEKGAPYLGEIIKLNDKGRRRFKALNVNIVSPLPAGIF